MQLQISSYVPGDTPVHACDARVKVVLLFAYTWMLFWVETWPGMGLMFLAFAALASLSRVGWGRCLAMGVPAYVMALFTVAFAAFNPAVGLAGGCFYGVRMVLLVLACVVVSFTTTSTELTDALGSFMGPLRRLRVPVDDIATVFSLAIRFIPLSAQELCKAHDAQSSRAARFSGSGLGATLHAWATVFVSLFVNLFRRADKLSIAMEARCYGLGEGRTSLQERPFTLQSGLTLVVGVVTLAAIAVLL